MKLAFFPGRHALVLALAAVGVAPAVGAQTMRSTSVTRQRHGEKELSARIEFGAGTLTIRPASGPTLYRMNLLYDAERFIPVSRFTAGIGQIQLGVENIGEAGLRVSSRRHLAQDAVIEVSPDVDLSLDATLGAVEAGIDLGGLRLIDARIRATASKSTVRFARPNPVICRSLELNAGAAEFQALLLGNSGCREIRFDGGMGEVTLDMEGQWAADARLVATVAVGGLTLRLPRSVGVELEVDRFLATFNPAGFTRKGAGYVSNGYDGKTRHLRIEITSKVGEVKVEWVN